MFYTSQTKDEIFAEFDEMGKSLSKKLDPIGLEFVKIEMTTRFFHFGRTEFPNAVADQIIKSHEVAPNLKITPVASCLSDLSIFIKYGSPRAFGFGMGNANLAAKTLFGYANAQNAFLQWILQAGFLTTAAMVLLIATVFAQRSKTRQFKKTMPLVILIYVYIMLGMVETTFSMSFFLWIGLLFALTNEREPQLSLQIE